MSTFPHKAAYRFLFKKKKKTAWILTGTVLNLWNNLGRVDFLVLLNLAIHKW